MKDSIKSAAKTGLFVYTSLVVALYFLQEKLVFIGASLGGEVTEAQLKTLPPHLSVQSLTRSDDKSFR